MIIRLLNHGLKYIAYTNIFTGLCAAGLVAFNLQVLHQALDVITIVQIITVGLFVTIGYQCSYAFNPHISFRTYSTNDSIQQYRLYIKWQIAIEGLLFVGCFFYCLHFFQALLLLVTIIIASNYYQYPKLLYPHTKYSIRYYGAYKTLGIAAVWVILTLGVPLLNNIDLYTNSRVMYLFLIELLFVGSLCLLFDLRDVKTDIITGVNSIPIAIGRTATQLSILSLTIFWLVVAIYIKLYSLHQPFIYITMCWVTFMVAYQNKQPSKLFYLILVDGTMLLPFLSINI